MTVDWKLTFQIAGACAVGSASALVFDNNALEAPSGNIVSALSIINAAIFPTVVLTSTIFKSNGLNVKLLSLYKIALRRQVSFFFGILSFSLLTITTIIIGQASEWSLSLPLPRTDYYLCLDGVFNFLIMFFGSFVAFRLPAFLQALVSLMDLHIDGVADEVYERARTRKEERLRELTDLPDIARHQLPPETTPVGG